MTVAVPSNGRNDLKENGQGTTVDAYPTPWEFTGLLTNGEAVFMRPIRADDIDRLVGFHSSLSATTVHRRFFGAHPVLGQVEARHFATVDYRLRMGIVAFVGGALVGFSSYDRIGDSASAEVAFVVTDPLQHHGIGSLMFECLAALRAGRRDRPLRCRCDRRERADAETVQLDWTWLHRGVRGWHRACRSRPFDERRVPTPM